MKKIIIFAVLISLCGFSFSEKIVWKDPNAKELFPMDANGKIAFTEIVEMPSMNKDALYSRAYEWFAKTFNSAQSVIQMQDKENGKIVGKALIPVTVIMEVPLDQPKFSTTINAGVVNYTLSISVKDGKYKYEVTDFFHNDRNESGFGSGGDLSNEKPEWGKGGIDDPEGAPIRDALNKSYWRQIKRQTDENIKALIENLKAFMAGQTIKDNW